MDKVAQKRTRRNRARESIGFFGKALESFSDEFRELMEKLREVDDEIRLEAAELKDLLKVAKTNFNRREYMTAVSYLGKFHDKVETIDEKLSKLAQSIDIKHHEFLFGDLDSEHLDYLTEHFNPKMDQLKNFKKKDLKKAAGITDWWHNLTTDRGKALRGWEKKLPQYSKKLKTETNSMISRSESFLQFLLSSFKKLASLRAARELEGYVKESEKFRSKFQNYNNQFISYYHNNIKKFVDQQKEIKEKELAELAEKMDEEADTQVFNRPVPLEPDDAETQVFNKKMPVNNVVPFKKVDKSSPIVSTTPAPVIPPVSFKPISVKRNPFPVPNEDLAVSQTIPGVGSGPAPAILPSRVNTTMHSKKSPAIRRLFDIGDSTMAGNVDTGLPTIIPNTIGAPTLAPNTIRDLDEITNAKNTMRLSPPDTIRDLDEITHDTIRELPDTQKNVHKNLAPDTLRDIASYENFIQKISSLEDEHPFVVAKEIINYAKSLNDSALSEKLISISKNILK